MFELEYSDRNPDTSKQDPFSTLTHVTVKAVNIGRTMPWVEFLILLHIITEIRKENTCTTGGALTLPWVMFSGFCDPKPTNCISVRRFELFDVVPLPIMHCAGNKSGRSLFERDFRFWGSIVLFTCCVVVLGRV